MIIYMYLSGIILMQESLDWLAL